jgi:Flp pilus assembly protein TadG
MLRRFWNSKDGNYAVIFSIAIIPIMAGVAGVVDFVGTSNEAAELQSKLDATALAVGTRYYSGMSDAELQELATEFFRGNENGSDTTDAPVTYASVEASAAGVAVTTAVKGEVHYLSVSSQIQHEGFLASSGPWLATRRSYVRVANGQPACVLALDPHAQSAVKIQGSTQVVLEGCVIASNSDADDSAFRGGSAQVTADCVSAVGGTVGLSLSGVHLACGRPLEKQYPALDPLAMIAPPQIAGCMSMPGGNTKTLSPGKYCGRTWSGNITLQPGVYVLDGGKIQLGGGGRLVGHGVTIFLMNGAEFTSNGNELIELSPSEDEPYAGITVFQERSDTKQLTINGGSGSKVSGFVYAPGAEVFYAGNSDMSGEGECIRIIGRTIEMTGNSLIRSDCYFGGKIMTAGRKITLVK